MIQVFNMKTRNKFWGSGVTGLLVLDPPLFFEDDVCICFADANFVLFQITSIDHFFLILLKQEEAMLSKVKTVKEQIEYIVAASEIITVSVDYCSVKMSLKIFYVRNLATLTIEFCKWQLLFMILFNLQLL